MKTILIEGKRIRCIPKKERLMIYKMLYLLYTKDTYDDSRKYGFCFAINAHIIKNYRFYRYPWVIYTNISLYPELYKYKPNSNSVYWFPLGDIEKRKEIITKVCKELNLI